MMMTSMSSLLLIFCIFFAAPSSSTALVIHNDNTTITKHQQHYDAIYSFGDSLTDTGNFIRSTAIPLPIIAKLPYGMTYFKRATGRCSDGRLILDFIADAFKLPYLPPYLSLSSSDHPPHGVNFAVAGATANDFKFFYNRNISWALWTNDSLSVQIGWFKEYKSSLCKSSNKDCLNHFERSLFIVGEIGGNDYNYISFLGSDIAESKAITPFIISAISGAISRVIEEGAKAVLVPGTLPAGCVGAYLTLFQSKNKADYDKQGCLIAYNVFAKYHDSQIKIALEKLRVKHPHVKIMFADFYGAALKCYHNPKNHGFSNGVLVGCCGGGGPYNFNKSAPCGYIGSKACTDPSTYANWDGIHLTEAAYKCIANELLSGGFSSPSLI